MAIDKKLIDQLLTDYKKPEDIIGENGLLKELTKAILERALAAEMTDHLGYEKHDPAGHRRGNTSLFVLFRKRRSSCFRSTSDADRRSTPSRIRRSKLKKQGVPRLKRRSSNCGRPQSSRHTISPSRRAFPRSSFSICRSSS